MDELEYLHADRTNLFLQLRKMTARVGIPLS